MPKINVYDFDGTIYAGDSSIDFFLYCFKKKHVSFKNCLKIVFYTPFYFLKIIDTKKYKEIFFNFLVNVNDYKILVTDFWLTKASNLKKPLLEIISQNKNNYIITASPEFLIQPFCNQNNLVLIGTKMNPHTGKITGKNCSREEKIRRLNEIITSYQIKTFYSDSKKDLPLAKIAQKSYKVKKEQIKIWKF